jgi:DNA-binding CsgD family transcriptional regulator
MNKLETRDRAKVQALQSDLRTLRIGDADLLERFVRELRDLLGTQATAVYGLQSSNGEHHEPSFLWSDGIDPVGFRRLFAEVLARHPVNWGLYDAARPDPAQCNVVMSWSPEEIVELKATKRSPVALELYPRIGIDGFGQLRVLVCEGPSLLAWVGAFQSDPYDTRQRALLAALVPDLQRRFAIERQLEQGGREALLDAVLDAIGRAAMVVDASGRVVEANAVARAALDERGRALRHELRDVVRDGAPEHPEWSATPVATSGHGVEHLVISRRSPAGSLAGLVAQAARRWSLSARQVEVLAKVAEGNANKTVAAMLGVSERTVEVHMTALLEKAQVESRAELIVKLYTLE